MMRDSGIRPLFGPKCALKTTDKIKQALSNCGFRRKSQFALRTNSPEVKHAQKKWRLAGLSKSQNNSLFRVSLTQMRFQPKAYILKKNSVYDRFLFA